MSDRLAARRPPTIRNLSTRTRRFAVTLGALAATALALSACQGTATTSTSSTSPRAEQAAVQQTQTGMTPADLQNLASAKRANQLAELRRAHPERLRNTDPGQPCQPASCSPAAGRSVVRAR